MKRKVNRVGQNTLTVSLPTRWAKKQGIKQGDEIDVVENKNSIALSIGDAVDALNSKTLDLDEPNLHHLRTVIASMYKTGYDEIILRFKAPPKIEQVNKIANTFTGLEVVSHENNSITIKSFLKTGQEELENLIIKMFQIIKLIASKIEKYWEKIDHKEIQSIVKENVIKLRDHCLRIIHSTKYEGDKSYDYYEFVTILEKIAGELLHVSSYISTQKPKRSRLTKEFVSLLDGVYNCYLKKDFNMTNKLWIKIRQKSESMYGDSNIAGTSKENGSGVAIHFYNMMMLFRHLSSRLVSINS